MFPRQIQPLFRFLFSITIFGLFCANAEIHNPTQSPFGSEVFVFDSSLSSRSMQSILDQLHEQQSNEQFGTKRYAILFKPGTYQLEVTVDYYMQVAGLGAKPGQVVIEGAVQSTTTTRKNNVTLMFWRSAENMTILPTSPDKLLYWAVSQAAPFRRMHVKGSLRFDKGGWASGGFLANCKVDGTAGTPTGQQWFTRNSTLGGWEGGNWNLTFAGVEGAPSPSWPHPPVTLVETTPVMREKPFLTFNAAGAWELFAPTLTRNDRGISWEKPEAGRVIPLEQCAILFPGKDTADSINAALEQGKHLIFTPGIYPLDDTLRVNHPDTLLLGLGFPTLIPQSGKPAIATADVDGIQLTGLILDAGPLRSPTLLEVGPSGASLRHRDNPTSLHDIFCRVGGLAAGQADSCVTINSHDVIADHFWLWRADHGNGVSWQDNPCRNGLVVNGNHVTIYGLFNEHFQEYQTLWNGDDGRTFFYQSEIPYDPPGNDEWRDDRGNPGYASYKVADTVQRHQAWGLGIYSFFRQKDVKASDIRLENSIECPEPAQVSFTHITNFAGRFGGINHVINGEGPALQPNQRVYFEQYPAETRSERDAAYPK